MTLIDVCTTYAAAVDLIRRVGFPDEYFCIAPAPGNCYSVYRSSKPATVGSPQLRLFA